MRVVLGSFFVLSLAAIAQTVPLAKRRCYAANGGVRPTGSSAGLGGRGSMAPKT